MRKFIFFAVAACVALAACTKTEPTENSDGFYFEKGQQVTLTVNTAVDTRAAGTYDSTNDKIDFTWNTGDKIKVTVGGSSAEFTLEGEGGSSSATFTGTMPGSGSTFDVQYPATDPDLSTQSYVENGIASGLMKATATGCTIDSGISLKPQYSVLKLNLYGNSEIGRITVTTKESPAKEYVLNCMVGDYAECGVEPSKTNNPKPFFVVVFTGTYGIEVSVSDIEDTELYSISTADDKKLKFEQDMFINMAPLGYPNTDKMPITIEYCGNSFIWAPVNCGYDAAYKYGKLYQWGRKDGQGYKDNGDYDDICSTLSLSSNQISNIADLSASVFYCNENNWYAGSNPAPDALWGSSKTAYDPCPFGWRVPTEVEFSVLFGGSTYKLSYDYGSHGDYYCYGFYLDATDRSSDEIGSAAVFLPAAGWLDNKSGAAQYRSEEDPHGYYWTSLFSSNNKAKALSLLDRDSWFIDFECAHGFSVRCIKD